MNTDDPFKPTTPPPMRHENINLPPHPPTITMPIEDWHTGRELARRDGFGVGFMFGIILASTGFMLLVLFT